MITRKVRYLYSKNAFTWMRIITYIYIVDYLIGDGLTPWQHRWKYAYGKNKKVVICILSDLPVAFTCLDWNWYITQTFSDPCQMRAKFIFDAISIVSNDTGQHKLSHTKVSITRGSITHEVYTHTTCEKCLALSVWWTISIQSTTNCQQF